MADSARLRGWKWDGPNAYLESWCDGTAVARFDDSDGLTVLIDGFDLNGQTITTADANGTADLTNMIGHYNSGDGSSNEGPMYCLVIKVGGTAYYIPAFTSV